MNVTPLNNGRMLPAGQVCEDVVERLEMLLEEARRGEIVGVSYAGIRPNGDATFGFCGWERVAVLGATTMMLQEATRTVLND